MAKGMEMEIQKSTGTSPGHLPCSLQPLLRTWHHTLHEALIWTQAWEDWKFPALSAVGLTQQGVTFGEGN